MKLEDLPVAQQNLLGQEMQNVSELIQSISKKISDVAGEEDVDLWKRVAQEMSDRAYPLLFSALARLPDFKKTPIGSRKSVSKLADLR